MNYKVDEKVWGWTVGGLRCQVHGLHAVAAGDQSVVVFSWLERAVGNRGRSVWGSGDKINSKELTVLNY